MLCFWGPLSSGKRPSRVGLQELLAREMAMRHVALSCKERLEHPVGWNPDGHKKKCAGEKRKKKIGVPDKEPRTHAR